MTKTIMKWCLIAILIFMASYIHIVVQGYLTSNAVFPVIKAFSAKSKMALAIIFITFNFIGAILTAIVTALPCGYLARKQAKIIAILLIISIQSIPVYIFFQESKVGSFITIVWIGQFISVIISILALAVIGNRIGASRQDKTTV